VKTVAARVAKGARLLDKAWANEGGWAHRVERPILTAIDNVCPLGQLYGGYLEGLDALGLTDYRPVIHDSDSESQAVTHGFHLPRRLPQDESSDAWYDLDAAWQAAVEERLTEAIL